VDLAVAELAEDPVALLLALVAVDALRRKAETKESFEMMRNLRFLKRIVFSAL
jgi:hypothetical protein